MIAMPVLGVYFNLIPTEKECGPYRASVKSVVAREKSANLVCQQNALQNASLRQPNPWKNVTKNECSLKKNLSGGADNSTKLHWWPC